VPELVCSAADTEKRDKYDSVNYTEQYIHIPQQVAATLNQIHLCLYSQNIYGHTEFIYFRDVFQ
jgi:hypothetical protein